MSLKRLLKKERKQVRSKDKIDSAKLFAKIEERGIHVEKHRKSSLMISLPFAATGAAALLLTLLLLPWKDFFLPSAPEPSPIDFSLDQSIPPAPSSAPIEAGSNSAPPHKERKDRLSLVNHAIIESFGYGTVEKDGDEIHLLCLDGEGTYSMPKFRDEEGEEQTLSGHLYSYVDIGEAVFFSFVEDPVASPYLGQFQSIYGESDNYYFVKESGHLYLLNEISKSGDYIPSNGEIQGFCLNGKAYFAGCKNRSEDNQDGDFAILSYQENENGLDVVEEKTLTTLYKGHLFHDRYGNIYLGSGRVYTKKGELLSLNSNDVHLGFDHRLYTPGYVLEEVEKKPYDLGTPDRYFVDPDHLYAEERFKLFHRSDNRLLYFTFLEKYLPDVEGKIDQINYCIIDLSVDPYEVKQHIFYHYFTYYGSFDNAIYCVADGTLYSCPIDNWLSKSQAAYLGVPLLRLNENGIKGIERLLVEDSGDIVFLAKDLGEGNCSYRYDPNSAKLWQENYSESYLSRCLYPMKNQ